MNRIPLESNLHKYDPVIISQIINMIEADNFWHHKTFESVMSDLWNILMEGIRELDNILMHCTNNAKNNAEMDGIEIINLCSVSQNKNEAHVEGKEITKKESQDKSKHDAADRMADELGTKNKSMTKNEEVEAVMMCWETTNNFLEEAHKEPEKLEKKPVQKTEKQKHEEEHVEPTLSTGNQLKISIEEFSLEREDNRSTLDMEELEEPELVYITNHKDGLQKDGMKLYDEEVPSQKNPAAKNRLIEEPL